MMAGTRMPPSHTVHFRRVNGSLLESHSPPLSFEAAVPWHVAMSWMQRLKRVFAIEIERCRLDHQRRSVYRSSQRHNAWQMFSCGFCDRLLFSVGACLGFARPKNQPNQCSLSSSRRSCSIG